MNATENEPDRMAALNAIVPRETAHAPFCRTIIEPDGTGYWLHADETCGFAFWYPAPEDCFRHWRIVAIEYDATSGVWTCEPAG